jgi:hypothetical protein
MSCRVASIVVLRRFLNPLIASNRLLHGPQCCIERQQAHINEDSLPNGSLQSPVLSPHGGSETHEREFGRISVG